MPVVDDDARWPLLRACSECRGCSDLERRRCRRAGRERAAASFVELVVAHGRRALRWLRGSEATP